MKKLDTWHLIFENICVCVYICSYIYIYMQVFILKNYLQTKHVKLYVHNM